MASQNAASKARQLLDPNYLKRRNLKQATRKNSSETVEGAATMPKSALSPQQQQTKRVPFRRPAARPLLQRLAAKAGCLVATPAAAFEADDLIACVCEDLSKGELLGPLAG